MDILKTHKGGLGQKKKKKKKRQKESKRKPEGYISFWIIVPK